MTPGVLAHLRLPVARGGRRTHASASARRAARAAVAWFAVGTIGLSAATLAAADVLLLRDPEYGRRAAALHARLADNPGRPLVLVVGSSRVGAAVCPAVWEAEHSGGPMFINLGRAGAGPVLQLMTLRRVLAEGVRPAVVLLEYWPPLMNHDHAPEFGRIPAEHVLARDLPTVRDYWHDGGTFERRARTSRLNPIFHLRRTLMLQIDPTWTPWPGRTEMVWDTLDGWGWLPGLDFPPEGCAERASWLARWEPVFRPQLRSFAVSGRADRALREAVAVARDHGAAVGLVHLPESSEFRGWYSRQAARAAREYLAGLSRELAVPAIDACEWLTDGLVADGFHPTRRGAQDFTRRLGAEVVGQFPEVRP
ncbi:MAG TPA: universal stress protein [Gemmata sp.]|nr:universal stress protein [Gemmata sp.]